MRRRWAAALFGVVAMLLTANEASAQLFGSRQLGGSLSRRPASGSADVGALTGNERFIRGRRSARDFVGSDSRERRGFVGSEAASTAGALRSAIQGLRSTVQPSAGLNPPLQRRRAADRYRARLVVSFDFTASTPETVQAELVRRLELSGAIVRSDQIEVSVEGRTATLRGVVPSEWDRSLIASLVLFEPGISEVRNELRVLPPPPEPGANLPAATDR